MFARRATPRTPGMRDWVRLVINIVLGACLVGQCSFNSTNVVSGVNEGGSKDGHGWSTKLHHPNHIVVLTPLRRYVMDILV